MVRAKTTSRKSTGSTTKNTKKSTKSEPSATEDFEAMKVTELKALCTERGLSTSGNKAELVKRLAKGAEKKTEKRKTTKKPVEESEEEVEEEQQESEDEESEEPPKKKSTKGKTTSKPPAKAKKSTKKVESEEELEDEPESSEEAVVVKKSSKGKSKKAPVESSEGSSESEREESEEKPARKSKKPSKVAPAKKSRSRKSKSDSEPEEEPEESSEEPAPKKTSKKGTETSSKKGKSSKAPSKSRKVESDESPAPAKKNTKVSSKKSSKKSSRKAKESSSESSSSSDEVEEVAQVHSKLAIGLADAIRESGLAGEEEEEEDEGPTLEDVIDAYLTKEHPEMVEEVQVDEVPEESAKDEEQVQEPASETKPSATQGPLKVSYDEEVQAFVADGFVFDVESKTVFAKLADGEIAALEEDDIKALDKLRIRHTEADEDRIIELVENNRKIRQGEVAAPDAEGAPEGDDDGEENAIQDVENGMKEITENPAPLIDEAKFKSFVVAQREQSNKTDFLAISKAAKLTEAEAQHIMLSYKTYADKYPQVISDAAVRTVKTAIGTKNDTRGAKPVRKFIRK